MNYYVVLGISDQASAAEIKSAFRNKAKVLHPDHSGKGCKPFQELLEAYAILSDPRRRSAYDQELRRKERRAVEPLVSEQRRSDRRRPPVEPMDQFYTSGDDVSLRNSFNSFMPDFENIFDRFRRNFLDSDIPKSEHAEEISVDVPVSYADAQIGGQIRVLIPAECMCPVCHGDRNIGGYPCMRCSEAGKIYGELPLIIHIPAGLTVDTHLSYSLEHFGIRNLYLTVRLYIQD